MTYKPFDKLTSAVKEFATEVFVDVESLYKKRNQLTLEFPDGLPNITDRHILYTLKQTSEGVTAPVVLIDGEIANSNTARQVCMYVALYVNKNVLVHD